MIRVSYFGDTEWLAALSKPAGAEGNRPDDHVVRRDDRQWTRGDAVEFGITAPWTLTWAPTP